jgi:hypothetical protein
LANLLAVGEHGELHPVLVAVDLGPVGPVEFGKGLLPLGFEVELFIADMVLLHEAFGDLAPRATGGGIDLVSRVSIGSRKGRPFRGYDCSLF